MKAIVCEMCGSQNLVKQDGMYVCQNCGTKYDLEEAKKLMVEVKINNNEKLKNLYQAARQARDSNDSESAARYYGLIIQEEPNSWEAVFYHTYYRAMETTIMNIASAGDSVRNCLPTVFSLVSQNISDMPSRKLAISEICLRVTALCQILESSARSTFKSSFESAGTLTDLQMSYFKTYHTRLESVINLIWVLGDLIEKNYPQDSDMQKLAVNSWKEGIKYWTSDYLLFDDRNHKKQIVETGYAAKVRKYEPSYTIPAPYTTGLPTNFVTVMYRTANKSGGLIGSSGGCYVATAVYGSYDCPQVWTLRRYRDYTLAETWYGRAFIRAYYAISPTLVKWFGDRAWFKNMWKPRLDKMVKELNENGIDNTPYQDKTWR